ncbi:YybH family protein [Sphingomonas sp. URHD0057]|uniref:YybH family protein n=1 Tax=Sphingomonas sp. URHD0057 TaxID=1380389 RepID=UPI00068814B3|nr:nuclear transport factor 2 family protein [Sphingomonas sp. URHD0057]
MIKPVTIALTGVAALALTGCHHREWKDHHHADASKIAADIKAQEVQWEKDYASKNPDALASHYADNGALGSPGAALATDSGARRKEMDSLTSDPNLKLSFASDVVEVARSGDLAYSRGHYSLQMTDAATKQPATSTGTYITVWKPQSDGKWKAVEDYIIPGPAPAAK